MDEQTAQKVKMLFEDAKKAVEARDTDKVIGINRELEKLGFKVEIIGDPASEMHQASLTRL